ncbi:MAG TPA: hypothetical protein DCY20_07710 [Firmicutes bacterium]|nr:hypothetical protein [Bacillota bacterium]
MDALIKKVESLNLERQLTLDDMPSVDLYMDQVIQLFESVYNETLRNDSEKVLTKTMINNYAKGKLLFPITNKKYSKDHLILISLIYQLKGSLSISDIKTSLDEINTKVVEKDEFLLKHLYQTYLSLADHNIELFKETIPKHVLSVQDQIKEIEEINMKSMEQFLLISSFVHMSNMYRKLAESMIDEIKND